jgi:hypothetical protein
MIILALLPSLARWPPRSYLWTRRQLGPDPDNYSCVDMVTAVDWMIGFGMSELDVVCGDVLYWASLGLLNSPMMAWCIVSRTLVTRCM